MIVKKRKKTWLNKDLTWYEDTVKINLNKNDVFEFDVPEHYIEVFRQSSFPDIKGGDRITDGGKVLFDAMTAFDGYFDLIQRHFKNEVIKLTEEKVLVVFLEGKTELGALDNVFRMSWGGFRTVHTFINFKFERGIRVGSIIYKIHDERFGGSDNAWERLHDTFSFSSAERNSKETQIVIPYTGEREAFLKSFKQELSNMIKKVDDFMDVFDNPRTLALIDNGGVSNLLTAPTPRIEDAEIIEEE